MLPRLISASTLKGSTVRNVAGENIGEIKDLMIDRENGSIAYSVLSFGGFLGMGNKLFAIPLEVLAFDEEKDHQLILNVDKDLLEGAPGFDKDNWPQDPDEAFISSVYTHYGYEPYWKKYQNI